MAYILPESAVDVTVGSVKYTGSLQGTIKDEKADLIFTLKSKPSRTLLTLQNFILFQRNLIRRLSLL